MDFKEPNSSHYRIRFLFEEDYCRLNISGDLGELTASNYNNMRYEHFSAFTDNIDYFREKIDCHSRKLYVYDEEMARNELMELIKEYELNDEIVKDSIYDNEEEAINDFIDDVLRDFDEYTGIGNAGYEVAEKYISDFWEKASDIGKKSTGILELYMLAFKLAKQQIDNKN